MASSSQTDRSEPSPRYDWYQTPTQVVLTLFVKNVESNRSFVTFTENQVCVELVTEAGEAALHKTFLLERPIVPKDSSYKILTSKVEIKLRKTDGHHWSAIESTAAPPDVKPQPRNWDKVVKDLVDVEPETDVGQLFQKIYNEGSDEVKMAMNKSFMESGGTELNTNWGAVQRDKVSIKPPDGMEWRGWEK